MNSRNIQPPELVLSHVANNKALLSHYAFFLLLKRRYAHTSFHNYRKRYKELADICGCGERTIRREISWMKENRWAVTTDKVNLTLISRDKLMTKITGWECYKSIKYYDIKCDTYTELKSYFDAIIINENFKKQEYALKNKIHSDQFDKLGQVGPKIYFSIYKKSIQRSYIEKYKWNSDEVLNSYNKDNFIDYFSNNTVNTDISLSRGGFARLSGISLSSASRRMKRLVDMEITKEESSYSREKMCKKAFHSLDFPKSCFWFKGYCYRRLVNKIKFNEGKFERNPSKVAAPILYIPMEVY